MQNVKTRGIFILLLALAVLSSCGVVRPRNSPLYYAGEPADPPYVPTGRVEINYHECSVPGPTHRRMIVYLPQGYDEGDERYPVVYLLHGARGYETAWIRKGRMLQVTDSVFTGGLAVPAIVVMPNINQYDDSFDYENSRRKDAFESLYEIDGTVESAFIRDVVSFVDSTYRTIPDAAHRAVCGLSIGGLQSFYLEANKPGTFGHIGMFSPMWKIITKPGPDNWFYRHIKKKMADMFAIEHPADVCIMIGTSDIFYLHVANLRKYMDKMGYPYTYVKTRGGHDWYNWTPYYVYFLEHTFR